MKLYKEDILHHYKNPENFGLIENPDFCSGEHNPSCGDSVVVTGNIRDGVIVAIGFQGSGCALSIAMASKLTSFVLQKSISSLDLSDGLVQELLGIELGLNRMMCGLLAIIALKNGIAKAKD
jgi:nitrogen fixation NifU-like protein